MKKFSKVAALSAAVLLVLGSTMTAIAATSVSTVSATASDISGVSATTSNGTSVTVSAVTETVVAQAQQAAVALVGMVDNSGAAAVQVEKVFELTAVINGPTDITMEVPGITAGQMLAVLHQKADGTWESVPVVNVSAGSVTATFTSLSPVAIVTYTSPRTGENMQIAGMIALVSMGAAVFCVRKYALGR